MTCKIERQADEHHTTLRLIGYLQAAHLEALQAHMESNGPRTVLDLDEVTGVEMARFLGGGEAAGIAVLHDPPSLREWIAREQRRERTHGMQESTHDRTSRPAEEMNLPIPRASLKVSLEQIGVEP
jgi:hypothetical protein